MRWVLSYILVASVALWLAFFFSFRFIGQARSQTPGNLPPPSAGDLPPEFMNETGAPPPAAQPGSIPPPPSQPPMPPSPPQQQAAPPPPPGVPQPMPVAQPPAVPPTMPSAVMPPMDMPIEVVVPQFADDDKYIYDPTGRRDPFKPYRAIRPGPVTTTVPGVPAAPGAQPTRPTIDLSDPLQRWDLGRFVVVAILWEVRTPRAMVKDPEGKVYTIAKNTRIGRNDGHVVAIREGEVVVVETIEKEGLQAKEVKILELKK